MAASWPFIDPGQDKALVGTGCDERFSGAARERFVDVAAVEADQQPSFVGKQVRSPTGQVA